VDVGIDADVLAAAEGQDQDQVRRLPSHARQRQQLLHRRWDPPAEALEERQRRRLHVARLVAVEAHRVDQALDFAGAEGRHTLGRRGGRKQARRGRIGGRVLRSRRQQRPDQHLERLVAARLGDLLDRRKVVLPDRAGEPRHHGGNRGAGKGNR